MTQHTTRASGRIMAALLLAALLSLTACQVPPMALTPTAIPPTEEPVISEPEAPPPALTLDSLRNAEIRDIYEQPIQLQDGLFEGQPFVEGSSSRPTVRWTDIVASGNLDGDEVEDAAVVLTENSGGSGVFIYLAALLNRDGHPDNASTILLGDRAHVQSLLIDSRTIQVEMITHGPDDPMCCPTQTVRNVYALREGTLVEISSEVIGAVAGEGPPPELVPAELLGQVWYWRAFLDTAGINNIAVDDPSRYTLQFFADETYALVADCNVGGGDVTFDGHSVTLEEGPMTLAACPPDSLDSEMISLLFDVTAWLLVDDQLYLDLMMDAGQMVFGRDAEPLALPEAGALTDELLRNGTYPSPITEEGFVTLRDAQWTGEPYVEGGATRPTVMLVEPIVYGDLDGDGDADAAVILAGNTGGSGVFMSLEAVINENGAPLPAGTADLGERSQVEAVTIVEGQIVADLIVHGPGDAMCCPTLPVTRRYVLTDGQTLELLQEVAGATPSGEELDAAGIVWIWQRFSGATADDDIVVSYPPAYRLEFLAGGRFQVQANCETLAGFYSASGGNLELLFDPPLDPASPVDCGPGTTENDLVTLLDQAVSMARQGEALLINVAEGGGTMRFSALTAVTGWITAPEGSDLPAENEVDVDIRDSTGKQVGGWMGTNRSGFPVTFEASFHPPFIKAEQTYLLEVVIRDGDGDVIYISSEPFPVLTYGYPTYHVAVEVVAFAVE